MAATKVSLKLFIDKKSHRVIFAEADKEFVDFLFSIFSLPVGAITRLLKEGGGMVGSLPGLYRSIENLSFSYYIQPGKDKRFLLEPRVFMPGAKVPLLLPNVGSTFRQLYKCSNKSCLYYSIIINFYSYVVAEDNSKICSSCQKNKMVRNECLVGPRLSFTSDGYVDRTAIYMVMDGLEVKVLSTNSFVTLFKEFNVDEIVDIEEKVVFFGMDEGVKLLQAAFHSETVLTDIFIPVEIIKTEESIKKEGC
ncbi:uncharacterized protein LOC133863393 [Alnus glutinosa]|uniref:uncharacterized protein LOC133863393 n=1 Tax=Alnus glutinosa TaxID=3517 RepID=UPI002D78A8F0|nr:uncharacterized protein LOC133863393 [Alnus glutinosa]